MIIKLPHRFIARDYQREVLEAFFLKKILHIYYVVHRRGGKDKVCINLITGAACERVGTYLYLFPQLNQARRVIWKGLDGHGMRFLDHIPKEIISKVNNSEMNVELLNGSIIQLGGSNNYDALMGTNPLGIVYSEYPLHNPLAREYLNPILLENGGWEFIQGTPRGKNHGWRLYQGALNNPNWFVRKLTIEDTRTHEGLAVITKAQVEEERRVGMSEELIRQEFYCDFNVGVQGAYYTHEMDKAEYERRICPLEIFPNRPIYTFWDIGVRDSTNIWFMQPDGEKLRMVYYYEMTNKGVEHFAEKLEEFRQKFNWKYQYHFAPHDIRKREWGACARSMLVSARDCGIHFLVVPDVGIRNGIEAVRAIFPYVWFNTEHCEQGIDALKEYRREWDEVNKIYKDNPFHNWASNGADAFRYFAVSWLEQFMKPQFNQVRKYQSLF